ncbi:hypothetical protein EWM64_g10364 [Hericium alpestre]|uniref:Peptidase A1 domain-containing protein n=1 Tax=Hericium alpestre TaxID=135208 RepID=A0A4Y9ZJ01_9AGAM|nr:hypothetical protein EWM64_g10364 [Hericium alpestre]
MKPSSLLVSALASGILPSLALRLPVERRTVASKGFVVSAHGCQTGNKGQLGLVNVKNNIYFTNITLGGVEVTVNVDTGSTNLVVVPQSHMTGANSTNFGPVLEGYGGGVAVDNISYAPFKLGSLRECDPGELNSSAADAPKGKAVVVLDTGAAMSDIPSPIADAIYENVPGAFFADEPGLWIVPCNTTANFTLDFAGQEYPVHPLDVTQVLSDTAKDGTQFSFCVGMWQPFNLGPTHFGGFDMLLGDAFLRNVYTACIYNYGNISKEGKPTATPYIQLLSTTNASEAAHDFKVSRKKQLSQLPPEAPASELPCLLELSSCNGTSNGTAQAH